MATRRRGRTDTDVLVGAVVGELSRTRLGRQTLIALAVLALFVFGGYWLWRNHLRPRHPVGPAVRVATWNIRQFSERRDTDLRAIAEVIRASSFDVLALQEVKRRGEQVDALLNELGVPW